MKNVVLTFIAIFFMVFGAHAQTESDREAQNKEMQPYVDLFFGTNVTQDKPTAIKEWKRLAQNGNYQAASNLGYMYMGKWGADKDLEESAKWYRIAVKGNHPVDIANLAWVLFQLKNYAESREWYLKSAEFEESNEDKEFALTYANIAGINDEIIESVDERADAVANIIKGSFENKQIGCFNDLLDVNITGLEDNAQLRSILQRLEQKAYNDIYAGMGVGWMYQKGLGTKKDLSKAISAYQGTSTPLGDLAIGNVYEEGPMGKPDYKTARIYYNYAIEGGLKSVGQARMAGLEYKPVKANEYTNYPNSLCYWKKNSTGSRDVVKENGKVIVPGDKYDVVGFETEVVIVKHNGKIGAIDYSGKLVVPTSYNSFEGTGTKEGRLLFVDKTSNGLKYFIYSTTGQLLASQSFLNTQYKASARFLHNWLIEIIQPAYL